jgi:hypothetical protein
MNDQICWLTHKISMWPFDGWLEAPQLFMLWSIIQTVHCGIYLPAPSPKDHDFSAYPQTDKPPYVHPSFLTKYSIAAIPNIAPNQPYNNTGPTPCDPSRDMTAAGTCSWGCNQCIRQQEDIATCAVRNEWGITYDDGYQT